MRAVLRRELSPAKILRKGLVECKLSESPDTPQRLRDQFTLIMKLTLSRVYGKVHAVAPPAVGVAPAVLAAPDLGVAPVVVPDPAAALPAVPAVPPDCSRAPLGSTHGCAGRELAPFCAGVCVRPLVFPS